MLPLLSVGATAEEVASRVQTIISNVAPVVSIALVVAVESPPPSADATSDIAIESFYLGNF